MLSAGSARDARWQPAFGQQVQRGELIRRGHVRLFRDRDFRVHGGLAMDRSPVEEDDTIFTRIDFLSWTIGASGQFG